MEIEALFMPIEISEDSSVFIRKNAGFQWNSKIVLTARVGSALMKVGVDIPVMIKSMSFRGKLRIQLKLTSEIPLVKTVEACFVEMPKIDFVLKPLKSFDLMDMPGLSNWMFATIYAVLGSQAVNPNKISIDLDKILKKGNESCLC
jgi:Ca2+-dependent lipid-binding protein